MIPREFQIEFSKVRYLTPRDFVEKLSKDLGVLGVVAGENYRFGYKASGDASDLLRLCNEYGIQAYIINSVMDKNQDPSSLYSYDAKERGQVSSTRVRYALAKGDMKYVSELLGRHHRLFLMAGDQEKFTSDRCRVSAPKSCLLNLAPREGVYENCSIMIDEKVIACRVVIDNTHIHLDWDKPTTCITCQQLNLVGIDIVG
nr:FAD synthetase 2, chloroplastic-like [Ipomoea batatas]